MLAEAETIQHRAYLGVQCVTAMRMEARVQGGIPLRNRFIGARLRIELGETDGERLQLLFDGTDLIEDGKAFFEDAAPGKRESVLRQVADGGVAGALERAVVERLETGERLEQRGFAGPICADERGAFAGRDEPACVFKESAWPKTTAGGAELQHEISLLLFSHFDAVATAGFAVRAAGFREATSACQSASVWSA